MLTYFGGDFDLFYSLAPEDRIAVYAFDVVRRKRETPAPSPMETYKQVAANAVRREHAIARMRANGSDEAGINAWLAASGL